MAIIKLTDPATLQTYSIGTDASGKMNLAYPATAGNIVQLDTSGQVVDVGFAVGDLIRYSSVTFNNTEDWGN
jgi:hypothetical protein